jgi:hypothetical protein
VKLVTDGNRAQDLHSAAKLFVERVGETLAFQTAHPRLARQIDMDDLVKGVNPGVSATGPHNDRFINQSKSAGQGGTQESHDRVVLRLIGEPTELLAVVGQVKAPALRGA